MKIQIKAVQELPSDICGWFHPDLELIDPRYDTNSEEPYTKEEWSQMQIDGNIDITVDSSIEIHEIEDAIGRETDGEWEGWVPTPPSDDHFLIAAFDTEEIECVLWWAKVRQSNTQMHNPAHPGEVLEEYISGMTVEDASMKIGIQFNRLKKILEGKMNLIHEDCVKLAKFFNTESKYWKNLQTQWSNFQEKCHD
jgi:addiction module HigA family antidote